MQPPCQTANIFLLIAVCCIPFFGCKPSERTAEDIHILVAASARDATQRTADQFLRQRPKEGRPKIVIASGASSSLAQQILAGAPADIFISANTAWSKAVADEATVSPLLTNRLVLATPKSDPQNVTSIGVLVEPRVKAIAIAGEGVPIGEYARQVIDGLTDSEQESIKPKLVFAKDSSALVAWLESGEVDAGFVYESDLKRSSDLKQVQRFDESLHDPIVYSIVIVADGDSAKRELCNEFLAWLKSDEGQAIFHDAGFESVLD